MTYTLVTAWIIQSSRWRGLKLIAALVFTFYGLMTFISQIETIAKVCRPGNGKNWSYPFPKDFVLRSLRHTCLTRLGEGGADSFTIMRVAGHSSVTGITAIRPPDGRDSSVSFRLAGTTESGSARGFEW